MSVSDFSWARAQRDISPIAKFVLIALADNSSDGWSTASIASISEYTNLDGSSVLHAIEELERSGKLTRSIGGVQLACEPEYAPPSRPKKKPIPHALRYAVFARDEFRCLRCGSDIHANLRADHITPESKGGDISLENLQTLCHSCNSWKGTKTIDFRGAAI